MNKTAVLESLVVGKERLSKHHDIYVEFKTEDPELEIEEAENPYEDDIPVAYTNDTNT